MDLFRKKLWNRRKTGVAGAGEGERKGCALEERDMACKRRSGRSLFDFGGICIRQELQLLR